MITTPPTLFPEIETYLSGYNHQEISEDRKAVLQPLIDFIQTKVENKQPIRINFICTHNSRRSHLAQVWAQTMAHHFDIPNVMCYSSGTETTALFPKVAETLENTGFKVSRLSDGENPIYSIKFADNELPITAFSKKLDTEFNPKNGFAAVMTCSQADGACPFVVGAEKRIPITFADPKAFDNTPQQSEKYLERSMQIANEMKYVFITVKQNLK
jgi:arsenate reductase